MSDGTDILIQLPEGITMLSATDCASSQVLGQFQRCGCQRTGVVQFINPTQAQAFGGRDRCAGHRQNSCMCRPHLATPAGWHPTLRATLKDELRRDLAMSRLATSATRFGQLADALGFSSAVAFRRAFKTWTGSTRGLYRTRQLRAPLDASGAAARP